MKINFVSCREENLFDPNLIFALNTYYISWKSLALRYRTRIKQISREKEEF